jgi:hypothetical protein
VKNQEKTRNAQEINGETLGYKTSNGEPCPFHLSYLILHPCPREKKTKEKGAFNRNAL